MWRGQGRSFDRSADAASGGYEQWSQQTRGDPSAELAARYAIPAGFGAPAATATTAACGYAAGRCVHAGAIWDVGATMGSSVPSGCEYDGGACGCAAGAASGYGYGGAATGGDTGADVRACASRDDGSADDFSTTIRSECNGLPTI